MNSFKKTGSSYVAFMGLLFSLSLVLTSVEYLIPPVPMLPPGVKLGLSNIVTMYCLFFLGKRPALTIVVLKSGFVFFIRGLTACMMSLSGGLLSVLVMMLLFFIPLNLSYLFLSIAGAITHNFGQMVVASFLLGAGLWAAYFPLLLISGVIMGNVTGILLKAVTPYFHVLSQSLLSGKRNGSAARVPAEKRIDLHGGK